MTIQQAMIKKLDEMLHDPDGTAILEDAASKGVPTSDVIKAAVLLDCVIEAIKERKSNENKPKE